MPNAEERSFSWVFYPTGISITSVKTSGDGIKFALKTRVNVCYQKMWSYFCQTSMRAIAAHLIFIVSQTYLLIVCSIKSVLGVEFPRRTSGINTFSIPMHFSSLDIWRIIEMKFPRHFVGISSHIITWK